MRQILDWMLGPFGQDVVGFLEGNPVIWTALIGFWFLLYLAARWQLHKIKSATETWLVVLAQELVASKPNMTAAGIYKRLLPRWKEEVTHWAWFVPNRLEIWPVAATPENILSKFDFSPGWINIALSRNGIHLQQAERS